jgi:hypothetical protein
MEDTIAAAGGIKQRMADGLEAPQTAEQESSVTVYEHALPPFAAAAMESLYESVYTSVARFSIYGAGDDVSAYVARIEGKITAVFLFKVEDDGIRVLNEQITLTQVELQRFADAMFARYACAKRISFWAIETRLRAFSYPCQRSYCLDDIVIKLPATEAEYLAMLGKSTRQSVKTALSRIRKRLPSYHFQMLTRDEVSPSQIRRIVAFSRARMAAKNKTTNVDAQEAERIIELVKVYGLVGIATVDGRLCAGMIGYRVGTRYSMQVIAHDPAYDEFRLGMLCCYQTLCGVIASGACESRMMGSSHRYKYNFLGVKTAFDSLTIYRSHAQRLLHAPTLMRTAWRGAKLRTTSWLLHAEHRDDRLSRHAAQLMTRLRNLKRGKRAVS